MQRKPRAFGVKSVLPLLALSLNFGLISNRASAQESACTAEREFFQLKQSGESANYIENGNYSEIEGTRYIALEIAYDAERTCFFGFATPGFDASTIDLAETGFGCFDSSSYRLNTKKQWCEWNTPGCESDPSTISIGIGNLYILDPSEQDLAWGDKDSLPASYPKTLKIQTFGPALSPESPRLPFPWEERLTPRLPLTVER